MSIAPETAARRNVLDGLGKQAALTFDEAVEVRKMGVKEPDCLVRSTALFVSALTTVPSEKTKSAAYAELLLGYGKTLLAFVVNSGLEGNVLSSDVEAALPKSSEDGGQGGDACAARIETPPEIKTEGDEGKEAEGASTHSATEPSVELPSAKRVQDDGEEERDSTPKLVAQGANADTAQKLPHKEDSHDEDEDEDEDGEVPTDEEDDISTEELTWEQLEHARLLFEALGEQYEGRLAEVHETLGDFLLETEQSEAAAVEFAKAAILMAKTLGPDSRFVADIHYRRYLALRREGPAEAVCALEDAIRVFKLVVDGNQRVGNFGQKNEKEETGPSAAEDAEVLREMSEELHAYKEALGPALGKVRSDAAGPSSARVAVKVLPKKRAVPVPVPVPVTGNECDGLDSKAKQARLDGDSSI